MHFPYFLLFSVPLFELSKQNRGLCFKVKNFELNVELSVADGYEFDALSNFLPKQWKNKRQNICAEYIKNFHVRARLTWDHECCSYKNEILFLYTQLRRMNFALERLHNVDRTRIVLDVPNQSVNIFTNYYINHSNYYIKHCVQTR